MRVVLMRVWNVFAIYCVNAVGFRFRACCAVFVRVFCDKCGDACIGASCL